jgi:hypothetical protein
MPEQRRFQDLSEAEARGVFDRYVAGHNQRLTELFREVGPELAQQLDYTRRSLATLWAWFVETHHPPREVVDDAVMRASVPPWWYEFYPSFGQRLGPGLARVVTLIAAYLADTIIRTRPGSTWALGTDRRAADYQTPLLEIAGRGRLEPDGVLMVTGSRWLRGQAANSDALVRLYDIYAGGEQMGEGEGETLPAYEVERGAEGAFETVISFDDVVAHEEEERIAQLVESLSREPEIEQAVHEDREIVLIRAPRMDDQALESAIARIWEALGRR